MTWLNLEGGGSAADLELTPCHSMYCTHRGVLAVSLTPDDLMNSQLPSSFKSVNQNCSPLYFPSPLKLVLTLGTLLPDNTPM